MFFNIKAYSITKTHCRDPDVTGQPAVERREVLGQKESREQESLTQKSKRGERRRRQAQSGLVSCEVPLQREGDTHRNISDQIGADNVPQRSCFVNVLEERWLLQLGIRDDSVRRGHRSWNLTREKEVAFLPITEIAKVLRERAWNNETSWADRSWRARSPA